MYMHIYIYIYVYIYIYIDAKSGHVNGYASVLVAPAIDGTHMHSVCIHGACMYLYPCASSYTDKRIADASPPHTRARVLRPCARVCACAIGRTRIRADTCERLPVGS